MTTYQDIRLEALCLAHAQPLFELTQRNRSYLRQWLPWLDNVNSLADEVTFVHNCMALAAEAKLYSYAIIVDEQPVGVVTCHDIDRFNRRTSLGYWLSEHMAGQGIMTHAVRRLTLKSFGDFGFNRVDVFCAVDNARSRAIPERLGFEFEGVLKQREWLYTRYVDHAVYALTRDQAKRLVVN